MRERKVKIAGWGNTLSGKKIEFDGQTRYRLDKDETLLMLAVRSARKALERAAMDISDMDCIMRHGNPAAGHSLQRCPGA